MNKNTIIITAPDHAKLSALIASGDLPPRVQEETRTLALELDRAQIVASDVVSPDVITMHSRAELLDLDSGERMAFTLVFPDEADASEGKISVLAPVGAGMLGYRVGDVFEQRTPAGVRRLQVAGVKFQPENSLLPAA